MGKKPCAKSKSKAVKSDEDSSSNVVNIKDAFKKSVANEMKAVVEAEQHRFDGLAIALAPQSADDTVRSPDTFDLDHCLLARPIWVRQTLADDTIGVAS